MIKMGYVIGEGLGKDGRGRAEPVPIQLLPQGIPWKLFFEFELHSALTCMEVPSSDTVSKAKASFCKHIDY